MRFGGGFELVEASGVWRLRGSRNATGVGVGGCDGRPREIAEYTDDVGLT